MRPSCLRLQFATKTPSQRSVRFNDEDTRIHLIPDINMVLYDEYDQSIYQSLVVTNKVLSTKLSSTVDNTDEVFHCCNYSKSRTFWDDDEDGINDDGESLDGDGEEMSSRSDDHSFYNEDPDSYLTSSRCSSRENDHHSYHHKRRKLNHQITSCRIRDELDDTRHRR